MKQFEYKVMQYSELIELAVAVGYNYDGDPGHTDNTDGVVIGLNIVGKAGWEFVESKEWRYFFKREINTIIYKRKD